MASTPPLPSRLSQALVAFTIEFDNEFARVMAKAGDPGARLSLVLWSNFMRFIVERGLPVQTLAADASLPLPATRSTLGCLERWRLVDLEPATAGEAVPLEAHRRAGRLLRTGWGSGRGIRSDWRVRLTDKGVQALAIWPPLVGAIDRRWRLRFGERLIVRLRRSLLAVVASRDCELPLGLPGGPFLAEWRAPTSPIAPTPPDLPLATLLSQVLLMFRLAFERESAVPLAVSANLLRVTNARGVRLADLPALTGAAPEAIRLGVLHRSRYLALSRDAGARRGQIVRLTPAGLEAERASRRLVGAIETRWDQRFGRETMDALRDSLEALFVLRDGGPPVAECLLPPSAVAPALGRRRVAAAARQRMRARVAQMTRFQSDPGGTLPHYPLWDFNRGWGP